MFFFFIFIFSDKDNTEYVDVFRVTALFHHLLEHLHLANSSYTLALLNPKPPNAGKRYGYRAGLAKWELDELAADAGWRSKLEILLSHRKAHEEVVQRPLAPIQNDLKNDGVGKLWAQWFLKYASDTVRNWKKFLFFKKKKKKKKKRLVIVDQLWIGAHHRLLDAWPNGRLLICLCMLLLVIWPWRFVC